MAPADFKNDLKIQRYDGIILNDEDASVLQPPIHRAIHRQVSRAIHQ